VKQNTELVEFVIQQHLAAASEIQILMPFKVLKLVQKTSDSM